MTVTIVKVFLVAVLFGEAKQDYVSDVEKKIFTNRIMNSSCVEKAKEKMNNFSRYSEEKKYAVALVNLYTQMCSTTEGIFFKKLNAELRSGDPSKFWDDAGDLLDKALDKLDKTTFPELYRSCDSSVTFIEGNVYRFKSFLSTSLSKSVAEKHFSQRSHFFRIKDAKGVSIADYSDFKDENEVLIEKSTKFKINEIEVDNKLTKVQMTKSSSLINIRDGDGGQCSPSDRDSGGNSGNGGGSGGGGVSSSQIPNIKVHVIVFAVIIYFC